MKTKQNRRRRQLRLLIFPAILILGFLIFKVVAKPSLSQSLVKLLDEVELRKPLLMAPKREHTFTKTLLERGSDKFFYAIYPSYKEEKLDRAIANFLDSSIKDGAGSVKIDYEESTNKEVRNVRFLKRSGRGKKSRYQVKTFCYNSKKKELVDLSKIYTSGLLEFLQKRLKEDKILMASTGKPAIDLSAFEDHEHSIDFIVGMDEKLKPLKLTVKKEDILGYNREHQYYRLEAKKGEFLRKKGPMIAMTFDDGPNRELTTRVLDILKKNRSKATFYVMGCHIPGNEDILKNIVKQGSEIGSHSMNHPELTTISDKEVVQEMEETNDLIVKATGIFPKTMRPPYGAWDQRVASLLRQPIILWSIDTYDWKTLDPQATIDTVLENVKEGDIILLHDVHPTSVEAAEKLIPELKKRGYQLVTVSELWRYYGQRQYPGVPYTALQMDN